MAAPNYVASSASVQHNPAGTTYVGTMPSGIPAGGGGEVLVMHLMIRATGATITTPTGWTLADSAFANNSVSNHLLWKAATGGEGATTPVISGSANAVSSLVVFRMQGASTTNPFPSGEKSQAVSPATNAATGTVPSVTTAGADRLLMLFYTNGASGAATPDAAMAERYDSPVNAGSNDRDLALADETRAAAGATGTRTGSWTSSQWTMQMLAAQPAPQTVYNPGTNIPWSAPLPADFLFPERHSGLGPFVGSDGLVTVFGTHSANPTRVYPVYSGGADLPTSGFAGAAAAELGDATALRCVACAQDSAAPDAVHVAMIQNSGRVGYAQFDLSAKTWGAVETVLTSATVTAGRHWVALCVRTGGEAVVAYSASESGGKGSVALKRRTGANAWTSAIVLDPSTGSYTNPVVVAGLSDRVHAFYRDNDTTSALHHTLSAANALSGGLPYDALTYASSPHIHAAPGWFDEPTGRLVRCPYADAGQALAFVEHESVDAPTFATDASVAAAPLKYSAGNAPIVAMGDLSGVANMGLSKTMRVLFADATNSDVFYNEADVNGAWGPEQAVYGGGTVNNLTARLVARGEGPRFGFAMDDGGAISYAEYDISSAEIGFPPTTGFTVY